MPNRMTAHAEWVLMVIQNNKNHWLTRSQIAELMNRNRLTPYDIKCIEMLVALGLVYWDKEEGYSRDGYRWRYGVFDTPPIELE